MECSIRERMIWLFLTATLILARVTAFAPRPRYRWNNKDRFLLLSSSNFGQNDQVVEAIQSLVDFHEGSWKGKAVSFTVTPDVAAGIIGRKFSPEYTVSVKLGLDANRDYSLTESLSWNDTFSSRSISFSKSNLDVDSVDASYSLDCTLPALPAAITGTDKLIQFCIEHCIATSDDQRMRCLVCYGVDQSLLRVVVCDEVRMKRDDSRSSDRNWPELLSDTLNPNNMVGEDIPAAGPAESKSVGSEQRPDRLQKSTPLDTSDGSRKLSYHSMSLMELTSGVWLGDVIIRDLPMIADTPEERGLGFGPSASVPKPSIRTDSFGSWSVGVQKAAWRWMWNFGAEIRQVIDVGRAMGAEMSSFLSQALSGSVCVNESLSRRISKDQRMVFIDWNADIVGFIVGSVSVQVPRYLNFNPSARRQTKPFFTEFSVYQSPKSDDGTKSIDDVENVALPEVYCSKISRVYNFEGRLRQGCTSFYSLKRFGEEKK